jgi:hypothetical protein
MVPTPITPEDRLTIERFTARFLESPYFQPAQAVLSEPEAYFAQRMPGQALDFWVAPREMLCGPPGADGLAPWRPVDSPVDEVMADGFERFLAAPLPPLFKAYLTYKCLIGMDLYEGTLPDIDPRRPLGWLEWCATRRRRPPFDSSRCLIPFTDGPAGAHTLAFDTSRRDGRGDCPVIFVKDPDDARDCPAGAGGEVFGSFASYLDLLQDWLSYKMTGAGVHFFDWLGQHAKAVPRAYYDALGA